MGRPGAPRKRAGAGLEKTGLAALGVGALFVVCCAALPLAAGVLGGLAIGATFGVGAGALALAVLATLVLLRARRRRAGRSQAMKEPTA